MDPEFNAILLLIGKGNPCSQRTVSKFIEDTETILMSPNTPGREAVKNYILA